VTDQGNKISNRGTEPVRFECPSPAAKMSAANFAEGLGLESRNAPSLRGLNSAEFRSEAGELGIGLGLGWDPNLKTRAQDLLRLYSIQKVY
jgi:hypothetical protein